MTKTFTIAGDIDQELMHELSEFYNELAEGDNAIILLSSDGGGSHSRDAIVTLLEIYKPITCLVGYGLLASAAFEIFFTYTGERELTGHCAGMYHRAYAAYVHDSSGRIKDTGDKFSLNALKKEHWEYATELCYHVGMTPSEIRKIYKGTDEYFSTRRMQEFLTSSKLKNALSERCMESAEKLETSEN